MKVLLLLNWIVLILLSAVNFIQSQRISLEYQDRTSNDNRLSSRIEATVQRADSQYRKLLYETNLVGFNDASDIMWNAGYDKNWEPYETKGMDEYVFQSTENEGNCVTVDLSTKIITTNQECPLIHSP